MQNPLLTISLELSNINYILDLLSDRPYREVAHMISSISNQANEEIERMNKLNNELDELENQCPPIPDEEPWTDEGKYVE